MRGAAERRRAGLLFALVWVAMLVAACGSPAATATPAPTTTDAAAPSDTASDVPADSSVPGDSGGPSVVPDSPVAGIVVGVDSFGLDQVKSFTLRTNDGETILFMLGTLENPTDFPPGHLKEHQTTAAPILVFFHVQNGSLVAYRIEDAG